MAIYPSMKAASVSLGYSADAIGCAMRDKDQCELKGLIFQREVSLNKAKDYFPEFTGIKFDKNGRPTDKYIDYCITKHFQSRKANKVPAYEQVLRRMGIK